MMNLYRVFWLEGSLLRHGVVQASDISSAVQCGYTPSSGNYEYVSTICGNVNGYPIVKVELIIETNDGT